MTTPGQGAQQEEDDEGLLVSPFPPPPYYYHLASTPGALEPPPIPTECFERAARKVASIAAAAKAESERMRQEAISGDAASSTAINASIKNDGTSDMGGTDAGSSSANAGGSDLTKKEEGASAVGDQAIITEEKGKEENGEEEEGEVVAVFGEIVEDPLLVQVEDECEDPTKIRDTVRKLNQEVMQGFVKLVHELVHRPLDNKKCRDELSHNIFLMLQECNKFREHQAREVLIETLEKQLAERHMALTELQKQIKIAEDEIERVEEAAPMLI
mmetsp:Transcript_21703/g.31443  ORF Transcript_21703/g.31443 Transcript_21703/m.31443 type:complete len:272 (+) Transcript_21703:48-863(+)